MSGVSAIPAVVNGLVTLFNTAGAALTPTVPVFDGPDLAASSAQESITVGADDLVAADMQSANEAQEWATIGATSKNVNGNVLCLVLCQSGATAVAPLRARAFTILGACESALRTDIDLDGLPVWWTGLNAVDLRQQQATSGAVVRVPFRVTYRARI